MEARRRTTRRYPFGESLGQGGFGETFLRYGKKTEARGCDVWPKRTTVRKSPEAREAWFPCRLTRQERAKGRGTRVLAGLDRDFCLDRWVRLVVAQFDVVGAKGEQVAALWIEPQGRRCQRLAR